jgi:hypothetical protein
MVGRALVPPTCLKSPLPPDLPAPHPISPLEVSVSSETLVSLQMGGQPLCFLHSRDLGLCGPLGLKYSRGLGWAV